MAGDYKPLKTVFHQSRDGKRVADQTYESRFTSPSSLHWDFSVGNYPLFVLLTEEIQGLLERVWKTELRIAHKWTTLPGVAGGHYLTGTPH